MGGKLGLHGHTGVKGCLHGHTGARMACIATQEWPTSVNCPHGHPPAGGPRGPLGPLGPLGGPQGAPWAPAPSPLRWVRRKKGKPPQKITLFAKMPPKGALGGPPGPLGGPLGPLGAPVGPLGPWEKPLKAYRPRKFENLPDN